MLVLQHSVGRVPSGEAADAIREDFMRHREI
jgi:hypothetical protein